MLNQEITQREQHPFHQHNGCRDDKGWWERWALEDYSWEGIRNRGWIVRTPEGSDIVVSMHDLWGAEQDKLMLAPDGKKYTRFHFPLYCRDSESPNGEYVTTEKYDWDDTFCREVRSELPDRVTVHRKQYYKCNRTGRLSINKEDFSNYTELFGDLYGKLDFSGVIIDEIPENALNSGDISTEYSCFSRMVVYAGNYRPHLNISLNNCLITRGIYAHAQQAFNLSIYESNIRNNIILANVGLQNLTIYGGYIDKLSFVDCTIDRISCSTNINEPLRCTFDNTKFVELADFRGSGLAFLGAFANCFILKELRIDYTKKTLGHDLDKYFESFVIPSAIKLRSYQVSLRTFSVNDFDNIFLLLQSGATRIRQYFKDNKNDTVANQFYRLELRSVENDYSMTVGDKLISCAYRISSNYGYDIGRPMIWILLLTISCSVFYIFLFLFTAKYGVEFTGDARFMFKQWPDAISFSISRNFPFIPWGNNIASPAKPFDFALRNATGTVGLVAHLTAVLQTVVCSALLFLSGLAARRRFKIND